MIRLDASKGSLVNARREMKRNAPSTLTMSFGGKARSKEEKKNDSTIKTNLNWSGDFFPFGCIHAQVDFERRSGRKGLEAAHMSVKWKSSVRNEIPFSPTHADGSGVGIRQINSQLNFVEICHLLTKRKHAKRKTRNCWCLRKFSP